MSEEKEDIPTFKSNDGDLTENFGTRNLQHGQGHVIHFVHVPTNKTAHFKAFLTAWEDSFKQTWKSTETVGRMDPIMIYSRTGRQINFSFDIPSYGSEEAAFNLLQVQTLIQMSYPTFETVDLSSGKVVGAVAGTSATPEQAAEAKAAAELYSQQNCKEVVKTISTMISPPFFRIKFSNWMNNPALDNSMTARDAMESGLYGVIENIKFSPDLSQDSGFYSSGPLFKQDNNPENVLVPKLMKLDMTFTVLHTNLLGYDNTSRQARTSDYPYNARKIYDKIKVK